jgi:hypothetical protein
MSNGVTIAGFRPTVTHLHREKSAAYRNSWKRRGETISIVANIARKVDRLENVVDGAPTTQDESLVDTVVDLFVYSLKYQTFLADQDEAVARMLFGQASVHPPYSDGVDGFDALLAQTELIQLEHSAVGSLVEATQDVLQEFARIEGALVEPVASVSERAERAGALANAAVRLLGVLRRDLPERYYDFLMQQAQVGEG